MNDYDIVNSMPSIILDICKKNNISCYNLERYVSNRNIIINEMMEEYNISRDDVKQLIIKTMNSEKKILFIGKKKIKNSYFLELQKEIKYIQDRLVDIYNELYLQIKKKKSSNIKGTLISYINGTIENEILEYIINKFPCNVKIFDGFLSNHNININELNEYSKKKYNVEWSRKDLDLDILEDLENLDITHNKISYVGESVLDVSKYLLKNKFTKLFKVQDEFYFHNGIIWINKEKEIKRLIKKDISNCDLHITHNNKYICINDNIKGVNDTYDFIINHTPINNNLLEEIWINTTNKLFFQNGYIDFTDMKFKKDNNDTPIIINRDFKYEKNEAARKEIYDKILNPIFGEDENKINSFLYELSRRISGDYEKKEWYVLEGVRNCGKGMICDLFINTFQNYIQTTNADNFSYKENNGDSAKSNSFLVDFEFVRLVITNEISLKENGKTYLDANKIKKFTSGGDRMEARKNYQDEKRFRLQCGLMICCNDLPERKPNDGNETLVHYIFNSKFIGEGEEEEIPNIKYYKKDNTLKSKFLTRKDIQNEFIILLLEHYNKPIKLEKDPFEIEEDSDYKKLYNLFNFTNNRKDRIYNKELYYLVLEEKKIPFTKSKISRLLRGKGCELGRDKDGRFISGLEISNI